MGKRKVELDVLEKRAIALLEEAMSIWPRTLKLSMEMAEEPDDPDEDFGDEVLTVVKVVNEKRGAGCSATTYQPVLKLDEIEML